MKPEHLHALLVDRACGELPPDVVDLLETYLAEHLVAASEADAIAGVLAAARGAMALPAATPPPVSAQGFASCRRHPGWREALRLAACLAAGAALGWLARSPILRGPDVPATQPTISVEINTPPVSGAAPRFWSVARFAAANGIRAERTTPASRPRQNL